MNIELHSFMQFYSPTLEKKRINEYVRLRGNMLSAKVYQDERQGAAATVSICPHGKREVPKFVIYRAGPKFGGDVLRCANPQDGPVSEGNSFSMEYSYYGPMLVQAVLIFEDGCIEVAHVYCDMP